MENTIHSLVTDFWSGLGIVITSLTIDIIGDDIDIRVETPDSALLIGIHGKNIEIFQHLLSRMIERKTEKYVHVHLEINDYMKLKDEKLMKLVDSKIALIQSNGHEIHLTNLTPYERKKAHNYIAEKGISGLATHSEGEGAERVLVLTYTNSVVAKPTFIHTPPITTEPLISDEGVGI